MGVGGVLGVGQKQIGVRMGALKIATTDGKITITLPAATKEMLGAWRLSAGDAGEEAADG